MKKKYQQGSAHAVVIVILVITILGLLGFVFWQNFINKPASSNVETTKTDGTKSDDTTKTFVAKKLGITFKYPADYTVTEDDSSLNEDIAKGEDLHTINITVLNKDGVRVATIGSDFQGGFTCEQSDFPFTVGYRDEHKLTIKYAKVAYYSAAIEGREGVGYSLKSGLTEQSHETTNTSTGCANSTASYVPGIDLDDAPLIFSVSFQSTQNFSFETFADAEKYLESDTYKEVSAMIRSFNFQ